MSAEHLSHQTLLRDLASPRYRIGAASKRWRLVSDAFPVVIFAVAATDAAAEYFFRFELSGFPGIAPEVNIWDCAANARLAQPHRPKGSPRVVEAFKDWGDNTVYRPWERKAGAHNNWSSTYPTLAWRPDRDIAFILEDLHGLLTANALADAARA